MSTPNRLSQAFPAVHPRGAIGLADDLVTYCRTAGARLTWRLGEAVAEPLDGGAPERVAVALRPAVLRAVLARFAAWCNGSRPASVSPYGGTGEFTDDGPPATTFRVRFGNTPDEQWLELTPLPARLQVTTNGTGGTQNVAGAGGEPAPDRTSSLT